MFTYAAFWTGRAVLHSSNTYSLRASCTQALNRALGTLGIRTDQKPLLVVLAVWWERRKGTTQLQLQVISASCMRLGP